jgi:Predicted membrane protein (DUF2061)
MADQGERCPPLSFLANTPIPSLPTRERHARSILKAISWRMTGTLDTSLVSLLVAGKMAIAGSIAAIENLKQRASVGADSLGTITILGALRHRIASQKRLRP